MRQPNNTGIVIILIISAAIFCRIILFEDSCFENFAKSCQHWTVYSAKLQAPGVELTNHSSELELNPGNIPEIPEILNFEFSNFKF